MKIELDELVQNSFVISIHPQRLDFFYSQWKSAGLPKLPKHIQGFQLGKCKYFNDNVKCRGIAKTHISVMQSHYMMVSMARTLHLPFVCIFEDDAVGCIGVKDKLQDMLNQIPEDADIFILGNMKTFGVKTDLGSIVVPTKTFGTQSYIVFHKNYDYFLDQISKDITSGLCNYGQNVYMAKDILFCQYSIDGSLNQEWNKNRLGFIHNSLSKDYINSHFKIIS